MYFLKGSRNKTILTIIIAAILISAALAGGKWDVGFAETIPVVYDIDPSVVPVNAAGYTYTLTGNDFIGVDYTQVRFVEPDGTLHDYIVPENVYGCVSEYVCTKLDVFFPHEWFLNFGTAQIWVINHPGIEPENEISGPYLIQILPINLYLPIVTNNN